MKPEPRAPDAKATSADRRAFGRAQRAHFPLEQWAQAPKPDAAGRSPLGWLKASNRGRVPELVPVRHGRMLATPFTFYRGAASLMANDLAGLPHSGIATQLCGDAHLANFGFFASPERSLVFDINDFDETLQGPFDWDVRRLATSFVVAARDLGFKPRTGRDAVRQLAEAYRDRMRRFARMDTLEAWYARLTSQTLLKLGAEDATELAVIKKARRSTSRVFAEEATEMVKGRLMVRKRFQLISIVLFGLALSQASANSSLADGGPMQSRDGASHVVSATQQFATAEPGSRLSQTSVAAPAVEPTNRSVAQPAGRLIDYPAFALLAVAIICAAALSRRDVEIGLKEGNG